MKIRRGTPNFRIVIASDAQNAAALARTSSHRCLGDVLLDLVERNDVAREQVKRAIVLQLRRDLLHDSKRGPHQPWAKAETGNPRRFQLAQGGLRRRSEDVDRRPDRFVEPPERPEIA
jgi:hypothetical protein